MKKTVCLNMIVKDESKVIRRCLGSLIEWIDYWVIVDTGSTDGTQEIIREFMKGRPGELHQSYWVNFAHNRNEVLEHSKGKGDYLLFIDADEMLQVQKPFSWPDLTEDLYFMKVQYQVGSEFTRTSLVNNHLDWKWYGLIHEEIRGDRPRNGVLLRNILTITTLDGEPSREMLIQKNLRDAKILENALSNEPDNIRYVFHLAMTYEVAEEYEKALKCFEKRLSMSGPDDGQIFYSLFRMARLQEKMKMDPRIFVETYQKAYSSRPTRAEPLYHLGNHFLESKNYLISYCLAKTALALPIPKVDPMLVDVPIYEIYLDILLIESASQIGRKEEAVRSCLKLLDKPSLPTDKRSWARKKLELFKR